MWASSGSLDQAGTRVSLIEDDLESTLLRLTRSKPQIDHMLAK